MKSFSLATRLAAYLLFSQLVVYLIIWVLNIPLSLTGVRVDLDLIRNDFAENRARDEVVASVANGADGAPRIQPIPSLNARMRQNPNLKFAVYDLDMKAALPGSSPDLVALLRGMGDIKAIQLNFWLESSRDPTLRGNLTKADTAIGRVIVVTYGYSFHWGDLYYFFRDNARDNFIYFVPVALAAAWIAWTAARRGLSPLRAAAAHAARIDMDSIDQRIPLMGIPAETMPLVVAVNEALARLDAGAARARRFAANAAHELRTPVAILRARLDAMADAPNKVELKRDVRRIQTIVEQLLIAARLGEHGGRLDEIVDLVAVVREMVADYAPLVIDNQRHIEFEAFAPSVPVRGNRRAIESVVANLFDNALRAEPVGGSVVARVKPGGVIEVADHGAGVPESDRDKIFEPFWRGGEGLPGTGLGLAIVKEIVAQHQGTIRVGETPGGGATFTITLPPSVEKV